MASDSLKYATRLFHPEKQVHEVHVKRPLGYGFEFSGLERRVDAFLDDMIVRYIGGRLDRVSKLGLEASMRLVPAVARLVADKADEQPGSSGSTPRIRRETSKNRAVRPDQHHSRHIDSL